MASLGNPFLTLAINAGSTSDGNALCASTADITPLAAAVDIQGAQKLANLYFQLPGSGVGVAPINQQIPTGFTLALNGKALDDLGSSSVLFTAGAFAQKTDITGAFYYQAFLDFDTDEIATAFSSLDSNVLECAVDIDLDVPATGGVPALQGVFRIALNLLRQAFAGTESSPTPATPTYPSPASINAALASIASLFRSDIESTAQVSAIASPVEGQQVAFLNGDNTLLSYRYLVSSDAAANGTTVLASTVAGAYWFLVNTFDTDGESISASATAFPGDVYSRNGTKRLLTTDDGANITWTPAITSVGTGASGSLETLATLTLPVSATLRQFIRTTGAGIESWVLQAGSDATSSDGSGNPAVQRPADFNASTNAKVWVRKG